MNEIKKLCCRTMVEPRLSSRLLFPLNIRVIHLAEGMTLKGGGSVPLSSK